MSCASEFTAKFRERGFRMTPQRMAILHALRHSGGHLSPGQVFDLSRKELPRLTEPTVYRTLEFLARNGFALSTHLVNGRTVYELAQRDHHHLMCRRCGTTIEVAQEPLNLLYRRLESATGYRLESGHLTMFGLCPDCQKRAP